MVIAFAFMVTPACNFVDYDLNIDPNNPDIAGNNVFILGFDWMVSGVEINSTKEARYLPLIFFFL